MERLEISMFFLLIILCARAEHGTKTVSKNKKG